MHIGFDQFVAFFVLFMGGSIVLEAVKSNTPPRDLLRLCLGITCLCGGFVARLVSNSILSPVLNCLAVTTGGLWLAIYLTRWVMLLAGNPENGTKRFFSVYWGLLIVGAVFLWSLELVVHGSHLFGFALGSGWFIGNVADAILRRFSKNYCAGLGKRQLIVPLGSCLGTLAYWPLSSLATPNWNVSPEIIPLLFLAGPILGTLIKAQPPAKPT
jgi:hypothetical protein